MTVQLCLAQDTEADQLLSENPFALLVGMLLDQQVPMETAFSGPKKIADRMSGFDAAEIADYDPDKFAALVLGKACDTPLSGLDGQADPDARADHRGSL